MGVHYCNGLLVQGLTQGNPSNPTGCFCLTPQDRLGLHQGPRRCLVQVPGSGQASGYQPPCSVASAATSTSASGLPSQPLSSSWCRELFAKPGPGRETPTSLQPGAREEKRREKGHEEGSARGDSHHHLPGWPLCARTEMLGNQWFSSHLNSPILKPPSVLGGKWSSGSSSQPATVG